MGSRLNASELRARLAEAEEREAAAEIAEASQEHTASGKPVCVAEGCSNETGFRRDNGRPIKWCKEHAPGARQAFKGMMADATEAQYGDVVRKAVKAAETVRPKATEKAPWEGVWTLTVNGLGYLLVSELGAEMEKRGGDHPDAALVSLAFPSIAAEKAARKVIETTGKLLPA